MEYIKFFAQGLVYLVAMLLPLILFITLQSKVNARFEKAISKAFFGTTNVKDAMKHTSGKLLVRLIAFAGIYIHEFVFWIAGWICGFIPSSFSVFSKDIKQDKSLGYDSFANITLNYRSTDVYGGKLKRMLNSLLRIASKLFGCVPYVAPVVVIAWIYRYVLVHYTYSMSWMTTAPYFKDTSIIKAIPTFVNYLVWGYSEIFSAPMILVVFVVLSLFLSYGLTMPAYDRQEAVAQSAFTIIIIYATILCRMATFQQVMPFCAQIILVSLYIFPLILVSEYLWIVIFNLIGSFKYTGKHDSMDDADDKTQDSDSKPVNLASNDAPADVQNAPKQITVQQQVNLNDVPVIKTGKKNVKKNVSGSKSVNSELADMAKKEGWLQ